VAGTPAAPGQRTARTDPDLAAVMAAWPDLPEPIRAGILAMVRASMVAPETAKSAANGGGQ
jgi:hypothetical protein